MIETLVTIASVAFLLAAGAIFLPEVPELLGTMMCLYGGAFLGGLAWHYVASGLSLAFAPAIITLVAFVVAGFLIGIEAAERLYESRTLLRHVQQRIDGFKLLGGNE